MKTFSETKFDMWPQWIEHALASENTSTTLKNEFGLPKKMSRPKVHFLKVSQNDMRKCHENVIFTNMS
jgi:hypothetical protein